MSRPPSLLTSIHSSLRTGQQVNWGRHNYSPPHTWTTVTRWLETMMKWPEVVLHLRHWCDSTNLDYDQRAGGGHFRRHKQTKHPPVYIDGEKVERVKSYKFIGDLLLVEYYTSSAKQNLYNKCNEQVLSRIYQSVQRFLAIKTLRLKQDI